MADYRLIFEECDYDNAYVVAGAEISVGKNVEVRIPSRHNKKRVVEIGKRAFKDCLGLLKVTIPGSVRLIGRNAFSGCMALAEVKMEEGVRFIEAHAFYKCTALEKLVLPYSLEQFYPSAISGCAKLREIFFQDEDWQWEMNVCRDIGNKVFDGVDVVCVGPPNSRIKDTHVYGDCDDTDNLDSPEGDYTLCFMTYKEGYVLTGIIVHGFNRLHVVIPSRVLGLPVIGIGDMAFFDEGEAAGCMFLFDVDIPDTVVDIFDSAFYACSNLRSLTIPDSVEYIETGAFCNCYGLERIVMGTGIKYIEPNTFSGYKGNIYFRRDKKYCEKNVDARFLFHSDFMCYFYSEDVPTEDGFYWRYDENGDITGTIVMDGKIFVPKDSQTQEYRG